MTFPVRKVLLVCASIAVFALLFGALPSPASASDKDCSDFATQRAAQIFYLKHGGPRYDPDRLDADHDGVACEDNPCPCYYKKYLPQRPDLELIADRRSLLQV
jgi:hypothetical protein